jgi:hypothetical protein
VTATHWPWRSQRFSAAGAAGWAKRARASDLAIAAAFFSPKGLSGLTLHLEGLDRVRLLFGVEAPCDIDVRRPRSRRAFRAFRGRGR